MGFTMSRRVDVRFLRRFAMRYEVRLQSDKEEVSMIYPWNEKKYQIIRQNPDRVAWRDFADDTARREFVDYFCIANPHLIKGSQEHLFWQDYFNACFHCNCTFPFIARLINSFMVTGEQAQ